MNASTFSGYSPRCGDHVIFVIFAVGQDHNRTRGLTLLVKAIPTSFNCAANSGSLRRHHAWPHSLEEQTQRIEVGGEWALDIGLACKHNQPQTVSCGAGGQPCDGPFGEVKSRHSDVFSHHAVADVQSHHHVDSLGFHFLQSAAHFGVKPSHKQGTQRESEKQVFPGWQENAVAGKNPIDAARI